MLQSKCFYYILLQKARENATTLDFTPTQTILHTAAYVIISLLMAKMIKRHFFTDLW